MPYEEHPSFDTPDNEKCIYKYMDFYKFSCLLNSSKLFFCKVTNFEDPREGCYPRKLYEMSIQDWRLNYKQTGTKEEDLNGIASATYDLLRSVYNQRGNNAVCSFCGATHEIDALWKLYSNLVSGVCIKTSIGKLKEALHDSKTIKVYIGEVKYISDAPNTWGSERVLSNLFWPYLRKIEEYRIENEIRAIVSKTKGHPIDEKGVFVDISLPHFIDEIILAPKSDRYFKDQVEQMLTNKGLTNIPVRKSNIYERPF